MNALDTLIEYNNKLAGVPAGVLVFLCCIAIGYFIKATHVVKNGFIPICVLATGVGLSMLTAPAITLGVEPRIWYGRNIMLGIVTAWLAWVAHRFILKKIEERFGLFLTNGHDTDFIRNPDTKTQPPKDT